MPKSANTADEYDFVNHDETALSPEILDKIREWLQPTDYLAESGEFRRHLASQAPGTGLWICETGEYRKWHDSPDHGSLWIKGIPGAGKSVTAASIIQHLRVTEDCPVLFFFFRNIVAANFTPRALFQDWLAQLLPYSPRLQFALQTRLGNSLAETSDNDLVQLFLDGVSSVPKLYCVADALDEMTSDNKLFLDKLNGLATYRPRSLKLLITSRPKQYLQSSLRDSSIVHISLQQQLVDADILSYLNHRFDTAPHSDARDRIKQQVIGMVARRSESLFLYAKLTMDQVEAALLSNDLVDIDKLEEALPVGLEEMYTTVLAKQRQVNKVSIDVQVLVLEAVTHASRPLRLYELASLIKCVCPEADAPRGFKALVATCCGPLVEILEDETLQVIHHSFTEFLRGDSRNASISNGSRHQFPIIMSNEAHKRMAINCLQYLQSGSLLLEDEDLDVVSEKSSLIYRAPSHQVDRDEQHYKRSILGLKEERDAFNYREARLLHPFLGYAVENWSFHASRYDVRDEELFAAIAKFLDPNSLSFLRWLVLKWGSTTKAKQSIEGIPTALHIAAFSGLSELAHQLIQQGSSVSDLDAQNRIPLHWAATNGHAKVTSLLIQHGSNPDAEDGRGLRPIHLAARKNHSSVVTILLEAGVEPDTIKTKENHAGRLLGGERRTKGETAIFYASEGGHTETVKALVPFCKPAILEELLCECCRYNRPDAVLGILEISDVSADAMSHGATALYLACLSASVKIVEALINRGADVNKPSGWAPRPVINGGGFRGADVATPPLHRLVKVWGSQNDTECRAILQMLIKANVDLEQLDGRGNTALVVAAGAPGDGNRRQIHEPAIRALLHAGADVKKVHYSGDTVLHLALGVHRSLEAVKLLIEHGSDPNQRGAGGHTALHCSMTQTGMITGIENTVDIVNYLLENGADPNLKDKHGNSPVYNALSAGPEVFRTLLAKCNDDIVKRQCWFHLSSEYNLEKFVTYSSLLLAEGIDINTRNKSGRTLYLCCLNSDDKLRILREQGARFDVVDNGGNNSLHILCQSNYCARERLEKLMANDKLDPLSTNAMGNTLLHDVAYWYNNEPQIADYVRWIVSLGVPVNAVNNKGSTALHVLQRKQSFGSTIHHGNRVHFIDAVNDMKDLNFDIRDDDGLSPLHLAAMQSETEVATMVAAGADLSFLTEDSQSVLHLACRSRQPSILGQILEQSASPEVNQKDSFGRTPLHYACSSGDPESVALLLRHGADVHAIDAAKCTPLHACTEFKAEQNIWDILSQSKTWLRGPTNDPLRPGARRQNPEPWYRYRYGSPKPGIRKEYFPNVKIIIQMLLDAKADIASVESGQLTVLDLALQTGCNEIVEMFATDEKLFNEFIKTLENGPKISKDPEQSQTYVRAQMALMRPRSALQILEANKATYDEVVKSPSLYLELLTCQDAATLIKQSFEMDQFAPSHYTVIEEIIRSGHLQLVEPLSQLMLHYSSFEAVKDKVERARLADTRYIDNPTLTALQIACGSPKSNMLFLKVLLEVLRVDVNASCATHHGDNYDNKSEIVPGGTALHLLASADRWWQVDGMRYLIAKGADVNAQDADGQTPIHIAARGKKHVNQSIVGFWRLSAVQTLLSHGADPNILDKKGLSPLHKASAAPDIMQELLRRGADTTAGKENPLFQAIFDQNLSVLETLIDNGVSVNSLDEQRHSRNVHYSLKESRKVYALLCAAYASQLNRSVKDTVPLLRALVERGADLYLPLNETETMIHFLFEWPAHSVSDTLLKEPCVSLIDFNRRDQRGRTVLMAACNFRENLPGYSHQQRDPEITGPPLRILDCKADATVVDDDGKTALHHLLDNPGMPDELLAEFVKRKEVAPTLLVKDHDGYTPFHHALRTLRPEICVLLLSKGCKLLEPDPKGLTALHYIASQCLTTSRSRRSESCLQIDLPKDNFDQCLALWQRFIKEGGSINVTDNAGNTPLHAYLSSPGMRTRSSDAAMCHLDHYDKLFPPDCGVDVSAVNHEGETALHIITRREKAYFVSEGHDRSLFEALMAKGLDPLKEDAKGRSALDIASACDKEDIVKILKRK